MVVPQPIPLANFGTTKRIKMVYRLVASVALQQHSVCPEQRNQLNTQLYVMPELLTTLKYSENGNLNKDVRIVRSGLLPVSNYITTTMTRNMQ
jgi:hypothetical protein